MQRAGEELVVAFLAECRGAVNCSATETAVIDLYVISTVYLSYKLQFFNQVMHLLFSHFFPPYICFDRIFVIIRGIPI